MTQRARFQAFAGAFFEELKSKSELSFRFASSRARKKTQFATGIEPRSWDRALDALLGGGFVCK